MERELNTKLMLRDITEMVSGDFYYDMEDKLYNSEKRFTQAEAKEMTNTILKIYQIAHSIDCKVCRKERYLSKLKDNK